VAAVDLINIFITSLLDYRHLFGAINFYYNILEYACTSFNFNSNAIILLGQFLLRNFISCSVPVLAAALTMVALLIVILNTTFFRPSAV
jgi:heme/copper-type cytochrome/quinol oxidase subunit 1